MTDDLISRQAAIEIVDRYDKSHMILKGKPMLGAASIVIELEDLPSAQPEKRTEKRTETHACDCISRQMLLEYIHGEPVGRLLCDKYNLDGLIEQFPSAQPERKKGHLRNMSY